MIEVVLGVILVVAAVAVCAGVSAWDRASFEERFPPISDAEFLARCSPGTRPEVALKVRRIVAEFMGVDYARVYPSMRFIEDLGAD